MPCAGAAAGRRDYDVCVKHAADAESIYCADSVKPPAVQVNAMLGWSPGERVGIKDCVSGLVAGQEILRL